MCNFAREHYKEHFCEIFGCPSVWQNGTIYTILVEGIMGNIPVILF